MDLLEDRCLMSVYVPLLPDQGTRQAEGLSSVLYTMDDLTVEQRPEPKLVTLMNNSSNVMFPIFYGANSTADGTAGTVVRLELTDEGLGYAPNPPGMTPGTTVTISLGSGANPTAATAIVQVDGQGKLYGLELVSGGSGYQVGDQVTVTFNSTTAPTRVATATATVSQFSSQFALYNPKDPLNKTYRGYVGEINSVTGNYDLGLQPGHQVTVMVPMAFWDGGRLYLATNGSVPLTSDDDPGHPLQADSEWLYNPSLTPITAPVNLGAGESYIVAPTVSEPMPEFGANFADPVTGYANPNGVVMWYRDLSAPHDFGFGVPAVLTEMTFRDPKQYFIAPDMPPSEIDTIINYDVSYVDSLALPASMEGSQVPTRPVDIPGPDQFTWLGSDMSSEQMQQFIASFTTNDLTGGTAGVGGVNGLGTYFGGLGYDQYYMPPDGTPSGAITGINNPPSGPVTIFTGSTGSLVNGMSVVISGVTGQTNLNATWEVSSVTPTSFVLVGALGSMTPTDGGTFAAETTGVHIQKLPAGFQVIADSQNQNVQSSFDSSKYNLVSGGTKANIATVGTGVSTVGSKNITGVSYATAVQMVAGMLWSPVNAASGKPYFPNGTRIESITLGTPGGTDSTIVMTLAANESGSPGGTGNGAGPGGSWTFNGSQFTSATGSIAASTNLITNVDPAVGIYLRVGMLVTGDQIPDGTFIASISTDFTQITLTQSIGGTASSGPYTFLGGPDSYIVQKLINVWYAWADYYVNQLASAPIGQFAGTTTANGGRTDYNSLILKVTNPAFVMSQLRVGDRITSAGSTLTPNTSGDPSLNYTIISFDESTRTVELSLPVAVMGAVADTFNFSPPEYIVRSSDAPMASGTAGTIPYTLDFAGATQAEKDNALNFSRTIYKVMQSFSLLLDPDSLMSRSALLLRYSIGGNVGSFVANNGFEPITGRFTILPHLRTHVQLRDEIKSILRGVYDFQVIKDESLWYPDPALKTPNATLDTSVAQNDPQEVDFGIYNISPFVWFVHTVLHNSSYGFSLDDDVANTTANSNSIQIAFGGNAFTAALDTDDPPAPFLKNPESYTNGAQYGTQHSQGFIDVTSSYAIENADNGMVTISGLNQVAVARLKASTDKSDPPGALITIDDSPGFLPPGVRVALVNVTDGWVSFLKPDNWIIPLGQETHQFTFSGFETRVPEDVTPTVTQAPPDDVITITGKNLTGVYGVSFNGIPGTIVGGAISSIVNPDTGTVTIHTLKTQASQALVDNDHVTISDVFGQTAINGTWIVSSVTHTATETTFVLNGITGNGVDSSGGAWIAGTDSAFKAIVPHFTPNVNGTTYPGPTGRIGVRNASGIDYSAIYFTIGSTGTPIFSGIGQQGDTTASGSLNSTVKLFGTGFTGTSAVSYNGTPINNFTSNATGTELQITIPVGASGTNQPFIVTVGGTPYTSTGYTFTVNAPTITSFDPANGPVGTKVTITGTGFTGADNPTTGGVTINGTAATNVQVIDDQHVSAIVAPGTATGMGPVVVKTSAGLDTSASNFTVDADPTPVINPTSPTPNSAPIGALIQLEGTDFTGVTGVTFDDGTTQTPATDFQVIDDSTINVYVPLGAATGTIFVSNPTNDSNSVPFTVALAGAPVISAFSPGAGFENEEVTLTGSGFTNVNQVEFNEEPAFFIVVNDSTLVTYVPNGATTGPITATNGLGTGTSATSFVVELLPTITSFTPGHGRAGDVVTVNGTGFSAVTQVRFNGTSANFTVFDDNLMTATVPVGVTTGRITISTGGNAASSATDFIVDPTITSFNPTSGAVGSQVTITGTGFTGATGVTFNGVAASTFQVVSNTSITVTVPTGATSGKIAVQGPAATGVSATDFFVNPAPTDSLAERLRLNDDFTVIGATGSPTQILSVKIFDSDGNLVSTVTPFDDLTSLRVATGDFDGDGRVAEFAVMGRRTGSDLRAEIVTYQIDANGNAAETGRFFAFTEEVLGNGFIATGDFNGDGRDDIAVSQIGGGRIVATVQIHINNGNGSFSLGGSTTIDFGVVSAPRISAGDTDGDGFDEIVVSARTEAGAQILVFDADSPSQPPVQQGAGFIWTFGIAGYARGAFVAVGEFDPTFTGEEIVLGSNVGGGGLVDIVHYDGVNSATLSENGRLMPFGAGYDAAVRVSVGHLDDRPVLVVGQDRFQDGQYSIMARRVNTGQVNPEFEEIPPVTALTAQDGLAPPSPDGNQTLGPFVAFANLTLPLGVTGLLGPTIPFADLLDSDLDDIDLAILLDRDQTQAPIDELDEVLATL